MPEKTPLNAVVHGKIERDRYTVEKVFFASTPGHYVCGNLYRPELKLKQIKPGSEKDGKFPAVLFAHGHWAKGRFQETPDAEAKAMVARGEEPDVERARYFMQAIPATLAKLGFVVFQYDMVGYADSTAVGHVARSGVPANDGFADAEGELRLQSLMGLQTLNSVRAVDFLCELNDVDDTRIGVTGASGGGTQTFLLAAIDDRIKAAVPAVMVSTAMQGGCVCENCSLLRVGTGNIELAGLFAPKPQALPSANDWTKEIMTKGYPELRKLYKLLGAEDNISAKAWTRLPHNYGRPAREYMYGWFSKHLKGVEEEIPESPFKPVPVADLSVFDDKHPRPKDELKAPELRKAMTAADEKATKAMTPEQLRLEGATGDGGERVAEVPPAVQPAEGLAGARGRVHGRLGVHRVAARSERGRRQTALLQGLHSQVRPRRKCSCGSTRTGRRRCSRTANRRPKSRRSSRPATASSHPTCSASARRPSPAGTR